MDIISAITSISQLLTSIVAVIQLYDDFKNAPKELLQLRGRIDIIQLQLTDIRRLYNTLRDHSEIFTDDFIYLSRRTLSEVWQAINAVRVTALGQKNESKLRQRLQWTFMGKKKVQEALRHLEATQTSLSCLLHQLEMCNPPYSDYFG